MGRNIETLTCVKPCLDPFSKIFTPGKLQDFYQDCNTTANGSLGVVSASMFKFCLHKYLCHLLNPKRSMKLIYDGSEKANVGAGNRPENFRCCLFYL